MNIYTLIRIGTVVDWIKGDCRAKGGSNNNTSNSVQFSEHRIWLQTGAGVRQVLFTLVVIRRAVTIVHTRSVRVARVVAAGLALFTRVSSRFTLAADSLHSHTASKHSISGVPRVRPTECRRSRSGSHGGGQWFQLLKSQTKRRGAVRVVLPTAPGVVPCSGSHPTPPPRRPLMSMS